MSTYFEASRSLIVIPINIVDPTRIVVIEAALDTGASRTMIHETTLLEAGYDPSASQQKFTVNTAGGRVTARGVTVARLSTLDANKVRFQVLAHKLPLGKKIQGLLGLDFLRG